jgi:hypothetical protein
MGRILRNAARCSRCHDEIESKHRHDFRSCSCGAIFVDGGKSYLRRGFRHESDIVELSEFAEDEPLEFGSGEGVGCDK